MYKPADKSQHSFFGFNQPMGLNMNPDNRWIKLADPIPWDVFEEKYAELFPSDTGNVAKPLQMALGSLIIQSLDTEGYARIERLSFEAYNESGCLQEAVGRFKGRTGRYPVGVLADQTYRTRENRRYCMGLIVTKLKETQLTSIALSVFVMNLFKIHHRVLSALFYIYDIFIVHSDWLSLKMA